MKIHQENSTVSPRTKKRFSTKVKTDDEEDGLDALEQKARLKPGKQRGRDEKDQQHPIAEEALDEEDGDDVDQGEQKLHPGIDAVHHGVAGKELAKGDVS